MSPQFKAWRGQRQVNIRTTGTKLLHHPTEGDLELDWSTLVCSDSTDQHVITWTAVPGSSTDEALRRLADSSQARNAT